ncbi:MAG: hypothetical protein HY423_08225 [Candidatus Lambdaproteobacteria bacterium]|nr:hypothetical protein [Candidatus Lambdaproteobacteria bacterium]
MTPDRAAADWEPRTFRAHDVDTGSKNRIHQDGLTQRLGFRGGFVTGATYYGQMTRELVTRYGEDWLGRGIVEMSFLKPVHEGDLLRVATAPLPERRGDRALRLSGRNQAGAEVVRVDTWLPAALPAPDPLAALAPEEWEGEPREFSFEALELNRPYRPGRFTWSKADNLLWCTALGDELPIYREGEAPPLHPALVVRTLKQRQFKTDGVQIVNKLVLRRALRVGQAIEVLTVPVEKYEKQGNLWTVLYNAVRVGGELAVEAYQTKILKMRGAA